MGYVQNLLKSLGPYLGCGTVILPRYKLLDDGFERMPDLDKVLCRMQDLVLKVAGRCRLLCSIFRDLIVLTDQD